MIDLTESAESGSDSDTMIRRTTKKADDILNFLVSSVVPIYACQGLIQGGGGGGGGGGG